MRSIAQYSPRMIVLILDGCRLFQFDEPLADGSTQKHVLIVPMGQTIKETGDALVAHACASNAGASDSGDHAIDKDSICHENYNPSQSRHMSFFVTGVYRKHLMMHLMKPNEHAHDVFYRVGRAVFLATEGTQSPVWPRCFTYSILAFSPCCCRFYMK